MKLSRASSYALSGLIHLARTKGDESVASHVVARACGIPERFLLKVLGPLVKARLLRSVKGPHGGYTLGKPARDITLLEVIEAVDGPIQAEAPEIFVMTLGPQHRPPDAAGVATTQQALQQVCEAVTAATREQFAQVSLASLAGKR
jgi:Rrf2 family protein